MAVLRGHTHSLIANPPRDFTQAKYRHENLRFGLVMLLMVARVVIRTIHLRASGQIYSSLTKRFCLSELIHKFAQSEILRSMCSNPIMP